MNFPKVILFDLDETIHFSEAMKAKAWSDILRPFGYCWEEEDINNLISVPKDKRPKHGLSPHDFIKTLIENLELNIAPKLQVDNLSPKEIKYRKDLTELTLDENKNEKMIEIMKDYWSFSLINDAQRFSKEGKIQEIPGAVEAIMTAHKKGYKIGVVTQAPVEYAEIVLKSLGLLNVEPTENFIDVVISGDMVENKKPHPESLILATDLIFQKNAIEIEEKRTGEKLLPEQETEIRRSIHEEYFGSDKEKFPNPVAIVGDTKRDMEAGSNYPGINPVLRILISNGLSYLQIIEIKHDITLLHFRELLPRFEENHLRKLERL